MHKGQRRQDRDGLVMMARNSSNLADTPTSPILLQSSPVRKSLFSMVVDIVQRVGSADWVATPPQCSGLQHCL